MACSSFLFLLKTFFLILARGQLDWLIAVEFTEPAGRSKKKFLTKNDELHSIAAVVDCSNSYKKS